MTWALCLNCGEVKFGAICPCPKCELASTGNMQLDIAFSDHHVSLESLRELGAVITAIHEQSSDSNLCFWTFIHYIAVYHSSILDVELKPEMKTRCEDLLRLVALPDVTIQPSPEKLQTELANSRRRWWQFWKRGKNGGQIPDGN